MPSRKRVTPCSASACASCARSRRSLPPTATRPPYGTPRSSATRPTLPLARRAELTDLRPGPACLADPIATVEAAATLLRTGRTTMALTLLEGLPGQIAAALAAAEPPPPSPTALQLEAAELARVRAH